MHQWLDNELVTMEIATHFAIGLTALCIVMDLRNYYLFRKEEAFIRQAVKRAPYSLSIVTTLLTLFYLLCIVFFMKIANNASHLTIRLTDEGEKRIGIATITTSEKLTHLAGGWTRIRSENNSQYIVRNSEIKEIRKGPFTD